MECNVCDIRPALGKCPGCGKSVCVACGVKCQGCGGVVCKEHVTVTPHGRSLCPKCWARREAKRREAREQRSGHSPTAGAHATVSAPASKPTGAPGAAAGESTSFEALMGGEAPAYKTKSATPPPKPGAAADQSVQGTAPERSTAEIDEDESTATAKPKQFHREVPVRETLDIDQRRPILSQSGYQAPSKLKYLAAFVFFGIAGLMFINSSPRVQDMMFPFELGGIEYDETARPVDQDTNALRNSSNINNFSLMRDLPLFLLTWAIVLVYVWGAFLVLKEVIPTLYQRWKGWRNEERMRGTGGL